MKRKQCSEMVHYSESFKKTKTVRTRRKRQRFLHQKKRLNQNAPNIIPVAPEANATNPGEEADVADSTSNISRPPRTTAGQLPARLGDYKVQL